MRYKTLELLYLLLYCHDQYFKPNWRYFGESFEGWAYRKGFLRQLERLEAQEFLERKVGPPDQRIYRLTEKGRLRALDGCDPEVRWSRPWDGKWRVVLYDVSVGQNALRNKLRNHLRLNGFGYLQNSGWITPDRLDDERKIFGRADINVEAFVVLEGKPCCGETDEDLVLGAWDFERINQCYEDYLKVLNSLPTEPLRTTAAANAFRRWAHSERAAWHEATSLDPLLPTQLLPKGYLGVKAWQKRNKAFSVAFDRIKTFGGVE